MYITVYFKLKFHLVYIGEILSNPTDFFPAPLLNKIKDALNLVPM